MRKPPRIAHAFLIVADLALGIFAFQTATLLGVASGLVLFVIAIVLFASMRREQRSSDRA